MNSGENERNNKLNKKKEEKKEINKSKKKNGIAKIFKGFLDEYKKIVWLRFKDLCKQTCNVIMACVFFGFIIFVIDIGMGYCMNYITGVFNK